MADGKIREYSVAEMTLCEKAKDAKMCNQGSFGGEPLHLELNYSCRSDRAAASTTFC